MTVTRSALVAVVALVAGVLSLLVSPPATAEDQPGLLLSRDGTTWSTHLDDPLFLPGLPWRPGEVRISTFLVRNDTGTPSDVRVALRRTPEPVDPYLTVSARSADGTTIDLVPDGAEHPLRLRGLAVGATATVTLRAALSADAPADAQVGATVVGYDVTTERSTTPGPSEHAILTTAHLELAPLFLGVALLGAIAAAGRRRSRRS